MKYFNREKMESVILLSLRSRLTTFLLISDKRDISSFLKSRLLILLTFKKFEFLCKGLIIILFSLIFLIDSSSGADTFTVGKKGFSVSKK